MRIYSVIIYDTRKKDLDAILYSLFSLSCFNFFTRSFIKEMLEFSSYEIISKSSLGEKITYKHEDFYCHAHITHDGLGFCITTDNEYSTRLTFSFIAECEKIFNTIHGSSWKNSTEKKIFETREIKILLDEYQNKEDTIANISKSLDETKNILIKSIDEIIDRGQKLDELVDKSQILSSQSKAFIKQSNGDTNCCHIL